MLRESGSWFNHAKLLTALNRAAMANLKFFRCCKTAYSYQPTAKDGGSSSFTTAWEPQVGHACHRGWGKHDLRIGFCAVVLMPSWSHWKKKRMWFYCCVTSWWVFKWFYVWNKCVSPAKTTTKPAPNRTIWILPKLDLCLSRSWSRAACRPLLRRKHCGHGLEVDTRDKRSLKLNYIKIHCLKSPGDESVSAQRDRGLIIKLYKIRTCAHIIYNVLYESRQSEI